MLDLLKSIALRESALRDSFRINKGNSDWSHMKHKDRGFQKIDSRKDLLLLLLLLLFFDSINFSFKIKSNFEFLNDLNCKYTCA